MPERKIIIGNWVFDSMSHLLEEIRRILHGTHIKGRVQNPEDHLFVNFLFACHPDYFLKVSGREITHYEVHNNIGGSRCFHAAFDRGASVHFSYKKCIERGVRRFTSSDSDRDDLRYLSARN